MRSKFFVRLSLSLTVFRLTTESLAAATCSIRFGWLKDRKRERAECGGWCLVVRRLMWVCGGGMCCVRSANVDAFMLCERHRNVAKNRKNDKTFAWQVAWKIDDMACLIVATTTTTATRIKTATKSTPSDACCRSRSLALVHSIGTQTASCP